MRHPTEAMKGLTPLLVLEVLSSEELAGLAILKRIRERSNNAIDIPDGTIYPLLYRLEAQSLVSGRWRAESGARKQRIYTLTDRGRRVLAQDRQTWTALMEGLDTFLKGVGKGVAT